MTGISKYSPLFQTIEAADQDGREMEVSRSDYEKIRSALLDYADYMCDAEKWQSFLWAMGEVDRLDKQYRAIRSL